MHALRALDAGQPLIDAELLKRYDRPGPRYTSYPAAPQFTTGFGVADLREHAARSNRQGGLRPLSLYVHVPFCFSPCFYCGCNRFITRDTAKGERYLEHLLHEIALTAPLFDREREVVQLHLGGGTPNFLSTDSLAWLIEGLGEAFTLSRAAARDYSIELDPRTTALEYAPALARLGFNRVSLGVQDFDPDVQQAVNRTQSSEQTLDLIDACRDSGFRSVNVDLIYGLPRQTPAAFRRTLRMVMSARPDRLAVYGYAHLPGLFKAQRRIEPTALPSAAERLELLRLAIEELALGGYRYIGMDHFALPDDELVQAQEAGTLQRNFMGYTTNAGCDLIGLGVSAISHIGASFSQNFRELKKWERALALGELPLWRGLSLSEDDRLRAEVIGSLMCQGVIDMRAIEARYGIEFRAYFGAALARLEPQVADGLVVIEEGRIIVTAIGRLLLRNVAMCFDAYLHAPAGAQQAQPSFSRAV
ncbi:MAG TPA: oxygen-independent coproporphyrinogen III oxidase [Steroidobacteraceae bacterium]|nr:oxygen-independent coproporphyrinogen III oxidase [Steroidobacteraceae bacterium]